MITKTTQEKSEYTRLCEYGARHNSFLAQGEFMATVCFEWHPFEFVQNDEILKDYIWYEHFRATTKFVKGNQRRNELKSHKIRRINIE